MSLTIQGYTDAEWDRIEGVCEPAVSLPPGERLLVATIARLQEAALHHPEEWAYWYALGDYCQRLDRLEPALNCCTVAYGLRPRDPRSVYAIATVLRAWADEYGCSEPPPGHTGDPSLVAAAHFCSLLTFPIADPDRQTVLSHLRSMEQRYPQVRRLLTDAARPTLASKAGKLPRFWFLRNLSDPFAIFVIFVIICVAFLVVFTVAALLITSGCLGL